MNYWQILANIFNEKIKNIQYITWLKLAGLNYRLSMNYYAPLSRPEGPRRWSDRSNAGGHWCFRTFLVTICWVCIPSRKINVSKKWFTHSTVDNLSYWVCIHTRNINVSQLESCNSTVGPSRDQESSPELNRFYWVCIHSRKIYVREGSKN